MKLYFPEPGKVPGHDPDYPYTRDEDIYTDLILELPTGKKAVLAEELCVSVNFSYNSDFSLGHIAVTHLICTLLPYINDDGKPNGVETIDFPSTLQPFLDGEAIESQLIELITDEANHVPF